MDVQTALDMGRNAMFLVLTVAGPVLAIGMGVGLVVALFQAVTQLQEQTLSFVPKIFAMAVATLLFVPWIANKMMEYARELLGQPPW